MPVNLILPFASFFAVPTTAPASFKRLKVNSFAFRLRPDNFFVKSNSTFTGATTKLLNSVSVPVLTVGFVAETFLSVDSPESS